MNVNPHDGPRPAAKRRGFARAFRRKAASFLRGTEGAAMTLALSFLLLFLVGVGSQMSDYAWQEAQWEELDAARRAAIAAVGVRLVAEDTTGVGQLIATVAQALLPGYSPGAITITDNQDGTTTVTFAGGTFTITDIFGSRGSVSTSITQVPDTDILVSVGTERYEVALALDITGSMSERLQGESVSKIAALRQATQAVVRTMRAVNAEDPGSVMVSAVPFATAVNVADTAADTPLVSVNPQPPRRTAAKERYVRMLAGVLHDGSAIDIGSSGTAGTTLYYAKQAADNGYGQWVDTFHRYGDGMDLGPLRSQGLPTALLSNQDWNLRRTRLEIDISQQRPGRPKWVVDDIDFWNGCLMARWGAYWATLHDSEASRVWPVTMDVPNWSPKGAKLANAPLHLSDAPPDANQPHTLFTAYSWPDASISAIDPPAGDTDLTAGPGSADHWLQVVMAKMLGPAGTLGVEGFGRRRFNDWTLPSTRSYIVNGGNAMCPEQPILPLSDNPDQLRDYLSGLRLAKWGVESSGYDLLGAARDFGEGYGTTNIPSGMAWALRTLSPLWAPVWKVKDRRGVERPLVPCATDQDTDCDEQARKWIVVVSDGENQASPARPSTTARAPRRGRNPSLYTRQDPICDSRDHETELTNYHKAWAETGEAQFNQHFQNAGVTLDANSRFNPDPSDPGADRALNAFTAFEGAHLASLATRHANRAAALRQFTPWELFHGRPNAVDAIMNPDNEFLDPGAGRPVQLGSWCQPQLPFSPYGASDELVLVGTDGPGDSGTPSPPQADVAPFAYSGAPIVTPGTGYIGRNIVQPAVSKLNGWLNEACRMAGERGVTLYAIYIGSRRSEAKHLEECVKAAGDDPNTNLFVTPSNAAIEQTFRGLFLVRRTLRFL